MVRASALALLALAACDQPRPPAPRSFVEVPDQFYVGRVHTVAFPDAGVTCWVMLGSDRGGISCLHDEGVRP